MLVTLRAKGLRPVNSPRIQSQHAVTRLGNKWTDWKRCVLGLLQRHVNLITKVSWRGFCQKKCSVNSIFQIKRGISNLKNFQLTVESIARLHWRCFIMLCDGSREITPHTALTSITRMTKPTAPWSNAFSLA